MYQAYHQPLTPKFSGKSFESTRELRRSIGRSNLREKLTQVRLSAAYLLQFLNLITAHVLFATPVNALDAVNKLHAHVFKGNLLSVGLKKRLDNLQKPSGQKDTSTIPSRAARLIIRNIPFNTTQQDLRAVFLPYGPIHSINIPTEKTNDNEEAPKKPRTRGFAFVWMMSKKDAERAIEGCNGTIMRAGMAENMVSDKQKRKKQRRVEKKMKEGMKKEKAEEEVEAEDEPDDENDEDTEERTIAVDWALSKDKWEEEKAKIVAAEDEDVEMENAASGSGSESDSSSHSESDDENDDGVGLHVGEKYDSESGSSNEDDAGSDEDEIPVKPQLPAPEDGTTLFVRNVPFSATEDELRTLYVLFLLSTNVTQSSRSRFRAFGPLRYARITLDPETGRSRGTGFACFWNKEDADKVVEQSALLRSETGLTEAVSNLFHRLARL